MRVCPLDDELCATCRWRQRHKRWLAPPRPSPARWPSSALPAAACTPPSLLRPALRLEERRKSIYESYRGVILQRPIMVWFLHEFQMQFSRNGRRESELLFKHGQSLWILEIFGFMTFFEHFLEVENFMKNDKVWKASSDNKPSTYCYPPVFRQASWPAPGRWGPPLPR